MPRPSTTTSHSRVQAHVSPMAVPTFKPFRDRQIDTLAVDCPSCGARGGEIREKCLKPGAVSTQSHGPRRKAAIRVENEARLTQASSDATVAVPTNAQEAS